MKTLQQKEMRGVNQYVFTHGKKPSGYGSWAFKDDDGKITFINGKYSDAKKEALRTIKNPVLQT